MVNAGNLREVVIHGSARYSDKEVERDNISLYNLGGTAEDSFVPDVDEGILF